MAYDPSATCTPDVRERAMRIRLLCLDVDGTLTDGRLYMDDAGRETKAFHVRDGQGLALLRRIGIVIDLLARGAHLLPLCARFLAAAASGFAGLRHSGQGHAAGEEDGDECPFHNCFLCWRPQRALPIESGHIEPLRMYLA